MISVIRRSVMLVMGLWRLYLIGSQTLSQAFDKGSAGHRSDVSHGHGDKWSLSLRGSVAPAHLRTGCARILLS